MNSKYSIIQVILITSMIVALYYLSVGIVSLSNNHQHTLKPSITNTIIVEQETDYYFSFDINYGLSDTMDMYDFNNGTRIDFVTLDSVYVTIRGTTTGDYFSINPYTNGTLVLNNNQVIGTVYLEPDTYEVIIVDVRGFVASDQEFQLIQEGLGLGLVLVITMPMLLIGLFITFVVIRVRHRRRVEKEIEFDGYHYQPQDANQLFDMENVWEDQDDVYHKYD